MDGFRYFILPCIINLELWMPRYMDERQHCIDTTDDVFLDDMALHVSEFKLHVGILAISITGVKSTPSLN